jgi:hypothetical protein
MRILATAAAALLISGAAYAQSAVQNPSVPGSGYQSPQATQSGAGTTSGMATPGQSGSGYKAPEKVNTSGPATNDKGELPKGGKNKD